MLKKYLFLSFLFFTNLYSMEDLSDPNEKTALLNSKFKEIGFNNNNINKEKKELLEYFSKDIWLCILSFLDYKENRKAFINFWAQIIELDDLTIKRIAIDIYRSAILNSKNLNQWEILNNNVCKSWKNEKNKDRVCQYLNVLNKNLKEEIKKNKPELLKNKNDIKKYWNEKIDILEYKNILFDIQNINLDLKNNKQIKKSEFVISLLELKRILLVHNNINSRIIRFNLNKSKRLFLTILFPVFLLVLFSAGLVTIGIDKNVFLKVLGGAFLILAVCLFIILYPKFHRWAYLIPLNEFVVSDVEISFIDLQEIINSNKINIFESDNYFLELLGHKFEQDCNILEFEDIDLKSNGKEEVSFQEDPAII